MYLVRVRCKWSNWIKQKLQTSLSHLTCTRFSNTVYIFKFHAVIVVNGAAAIVRAELSVKLDRRMSELGGTVLAVHVGALSEHRGSF